MMPKDILFLDGVSFNNILNLIDILNITLTAEDLAS